MKMNETKTNEILEETLSQRLSSITRNITSRSNSLSMKDVAKLTDSELLKTLLFEQFKLEGLSEKELKKHARQIDGQKKFLEYINRHGGTMKQTDYANLLGVTRQAIYNRIKNGSLIAITDGNDRVIPLFQYDSATSAEVIGLTTINKALGEREIGNSSMCTFWLSKRSSLQNHEEPFSPIDYLSTHGEEGVNKILKMARLLGEMGR
ncbi:hypothetical protein [Vibrio alginolyticus]|uniref:hypothetical protein n=1 Tax=Vibrio alginolyticus TaxID=663 RepID=UPI0006CA8802|nr:hypothetical protein [Vibrio alginolyticus]KPM97595.1 hypothetical protein AOG25_14090 [Vibrio alginolyticus]CAH7201919.1 conserved hypothetical protein [Vibrio chagasii]CAH7369192.1 conserved hypothetical protein [Vibrio chagasii]